jgi:lysophospholipase L1-like esterase
MLQARYTRSSDVITRGFSGYNTKWFLKYVMPVLEQEIRIRAYSPPSLITVWLGTNDAVLVNGSNSEMHVPVEEYKNNLVEVVKAFQSVAPDAGILMITPPHIGDETRAKYAAERTDAKRGRLDRSNAATGNYSHACVEVAMERKVPVLDLYAYFNAMPVATRDAMLVDGIHFNAAGNEVVNEQIRSKIETEFPALAEALQVWQIPAASKYVAEDPYSNSTLD